MTTAQDRIEGELRRLGLSSELSQPLIGLVEAVDRALLETAHGEPSPTHVDAPVVTEPVTDGSGWVWRAPNPRPQGAVDGPLRGWRFAVKDLIAVAGRPIGAGSLACFDAPLQTRDAPVVTSLHDAGATLVGTTKLHEFAFGTTGITLAGGTPDNPRAPGCIPGGSSSGSAVVVAAGEADLALGTDTGGSVRIPAALCGTVGFKPAFGSLSTAGVFALAPSLDHVGFLVVDAERLVRPARALGLAEGGPPTNRSRLGWAKGALDLVDAPVRGAIEQTLETLQRAGATIVEVAWPLGEVVFAATTAIMFVEAAYGHRARLATRSALYGADVRARLIQGAAVDWASYLQARLVREALRHRCTELLHGLDAVLTPTVPIQAPEVAAALADPALGASLVTFTRLADLTGLPAVSLPLPGYTKPIGLQLEAATDATALRTARGVAKILAS